MDKTEMLNALDRIIAYKTTLDIYRQGTFLSKNQQGNQNNEVTKAISGLIDMELDLIRSLAIDY